MVTFPNFPSPKFFPSLSCDLGHSQLGSSGSSYSDTVVTTVLSELSLDRFKVRAWRSILMTGATMKLEFGVDVDADVGDDVDAVVVVVYGRSMITFLVQCVS